MIGIPKFDPYPVGVWINSREETLGFEMLNQKNMTYLALVGYTGHSGFLCLSQLL